MNKLTFDDIQKINRKNLVDYWKQHNLTIDDFYCRDCGKLMLDLDNLKDVGYNPTIKNEQVKLYHIKKNDQYVESEQNRWLVRGRTLSGKTYFRHICWECFFKKLPQIMDIPKLARRSSWYKDIRDGKMRPPATCSSPSKYFKLLFDITDAELEVEHKKFDTASKEAFIRRHGEKEGEKKYEEYKKRQAYTCSKEYMIEEKGLTEEDWKKYNQSRASTLENFIRRYGEIEGNKRWNEYCAYEGYAGSSLKWFIDKYGEEKGKEIYQEINRKREKKFARAYSDISQDLFRRIDESLGEEKSKDSFYHTKNHEYEFRVTFMDGYKRIIRADYYLNGKIIEFNGDYWHANPKIYKADDELSFYSKEAKLAKDIWEHDKIKEDLLIKEGCKILVVWESDYKKNTEEVINKCLQFLEN